MDNDASFIFEKTSCLSEQLLLDYLNGDLDKETAHRVEAHIADCEFCTDALEGLGSVRNKQSIPLIIRQIHHQLRHELQAHQLKSRKTKTYTWLSALIFLILLIVIIAFMAIHFALKKGKSGGPPSTPPVNIEKIK